MFHKDQPVPSRGTACLDDPLSIGCGATITLKESRDAGAAGGKLRATVLGRRVLHAGLVSLKPPVIHGDMQSYPILPDRLGRVA